MIDENRERVITSAAFRLGARTVDFDFTRTGLALCRKDDGAGFDKLAADINGTVEEPSGIVAHVENKSVHSLLLELVEGVGKLDRSGLTELENPGITHPIGGRETGIENAGIFHRRLLDDLALHLEFVQLLRRGPADREGDRLARLTLEHVHRLGDSDVFGELIVDLEDLITGQDPGAGGRPILTRGHDREGFALGRDGDTNALVGTVGVALELLEDLRLHELAVRIEIGKHALESTVDELLVGHLIRVHITLAYRLEHLGEKLYLLESGIGIHLHLLCARIERPCRQRCQSRKE